MVTLKKLSDEKFNMLMADTEKGLNDWDYALTEKAMRDKSHGSDYRKKSNAFRCIFCRVRYGKMRIFRSTKKKIGLKRPSVNYVETNLNQHSTSWQN